MRGRVLLLGAVAALLALRLTGAEAHAVTTPAGSMTLTSPVFTNGGTIPTEFTCSGMDISPPLTWSGVPATTESLALTVIDPDAPVKPFTHWLIFDIPVAATGLARAVPLGKELPDGSRQGRNDFHQDGYGGLCPPPGPAHHYHFTVYALDTVLGLPGGIAEPAFADSIQGHVLAVGELIGLFGR
jgi:Raf kinase inhibitor-like YbhB/YbcL family protein